MVRHVHHVILGLFDQVIQVFLKISAVNSGQRSLNGVEADGFLRQIDDRFK